MKYAAILYYSCILLPAFARNPKRGISYPSANNPGDIANANQTNSNISWVYNWGVTPTQDLASSGLEFIPMQWGSQGIDKLASGLKGQNAKVLLTFNEPDFNDQSNIDPAKAAELWKKYIEPLKSTGIRLGAPAVSSDSTGVPWLTAFFSACSGCTFDFIPIHWYGAGVEGFYNYIWQIHGQFNNATVWVTEWADISTNSEDVSSALNATINYLDTLDWIERYAWFGFFRPDHKNGYNFMNDDGSLNSLGQEYIGADTVVKTGPSMQASSGDGANGALASNGVPPSVFLSDFSSRLYGIVTVVAACIVGTAWTQAAW